MLQDLKTYPAQVFCIDGHNVESTLVDKVFEALVVRLSDGDPSYETHIGTERMIYGYRKDTYINSVEQLICHLKETHLVTGLNVQFSREVIPSVVGELPEPSMSTASSSDLPCVRYFS